MARQIIPKTVIVYADEEGNEPYTNWLEGLKDQKTKERIRVRIRRLETGNYGDYKSVGEGVLELRIVFGPGYRVYFGEDQDNIVVLLCGGDKGSQTQDVRNAREYWKDYKEDGEETTV